ncbi:MAG: hypothetical protein WCO66_04785 [Candidatus Absconditabacteria bacterium]
MTKFLQDMLKKAHLFTIWDYSILKWSVLFFGIWLAIVRPAVTTVNPRIYAILFLAGWGYLLWKMFRGKKHK